MNLDPDVVEMSVGERGAEIMRLRSAIRARRDASGNKKCWILDQKLYETLPETKEAGTISLPRDVFLGNCERYYDRNQSYAAKHGSVEFKKCECKKVPCKHMHDGPVFHHE